MNLLSKNSLSAFPQMPLFTQLSEEMNRFFDQPLGMGEPRDLLAGGTWQPAVDIQQKEDKFIVCADIPGVNPKDVRVSMENGVFTIEGKTESITAQNREDYRRVERCYGAFHRSFSLNEAVDVKKIEAHCHNGVLEVIIPLMASATQNRIEIKVD
jgi:HSP20 family protein